MSEACTLAEESVGGLITFHWFWRQAWRGWGSSGSGLAGAYCVRGISEGWKGCCAGRAHPGQSCDVRRV